MEDLLVKVPIKPGRHGKTILYKYYEQGIDSPSQEVVEMVKNSKGTEREAIEPRT
jgi:hypothetical protein